MIRRPPRSTQSRSSAASDVYKRQGLNVRPLLESLCQREYISKLQIAPLWDTRGNARNAHFRCNQQLCDVHRSDVAVEVGVCGNNDLAHIVQVYTFDKAA